MPVSLKSCPNCGGEFASGFPFARHAKSCGQPAAAEKPPQAAAPKLEVEKNGWKLLEGSDGRFAICGRDGRPLGFYDDRETAIRELSNFARFKAR